MGLINDHAKADDRDGVSRNRQPIWRTASPGASGEAHSLQGQFEKVSKGEASQASGEGHSLAFHQRSFVSHLWSSVAQSKERIHNVESGLLG